MWTCEAYKQQNSLLLFGLMRGRVQWNDCGPLRRWVWDRHVTGFEKLCLKLGGADTGVDFHLMTAKDIAWGYARAERLANLVYTTILTEEKTQPT